MKNVTKILTAVVLCAAVFASTNRTDALGGNSAFWPGDEANIEQFPAQINNHAFVQLDGINGAWDASCEDGVSTDKATCEAADCDGVACVWTEAGDTKASANMVFNHNGTAWGLSFSDNADDWIKLSWGKNGMGLAFTMQNSERQIPDSEDYEAAIENDAVWTPGEAEVVCTYTDTDSDGVSATDTCTDGAGAACAGFTAGTDDATACSALGSAATDNACTADGWTLGDGEEACDNSEDQVGTAAHVKTMDDWGFSYGNTFDWGEIGVHYNSAGDMSFDFRKACGFWVFTDMVAELDMPDAGPMSMGADWFTHWDASGADVMFAMGFDYVDSYDHDGVATTADDGGFMAQTAAIGVEANMTDWASFRAGVNWNYQFDGDDEEVGPFNYGWATGLGFNWGGFTADLSVEDELLADPVGHMTGYAGSLTNSTIQLTYSF